MNILLCGLPFSGKSTYGALAAIKLKQPHLDTDKALELYFEQSTGKNLSCRQIYQELGENAFRKLEEESIEHMVEIHKNQKFLVISLGGGALLSSKNTAALKKFGMIVFLKTPIETLLNRLKHQETLPAYLSKANPIEDFKALAETRQNHYESFADIIINTEHMRDVEIVEAICRCPSTLAHRL